MRIKILFLAILVMLFSCENKDSDLGEFNGCAYLIDMTQENRFDISFLLQNWFISKVVFETYEDGILQSSEDQTDKWNGFEVSFSSDHTMTYGGLLGTWLYSHNYLLWRHANLTEVAEVVQLTRNVLQIKTEFITMGAPYYINKSGTHCFWVYEYHAK